MVSGGHRAPTPTPTPRPEGALVNNHADGGTCALSCSALTQRRQNHLNQAFNQLLSEIPRGFSDAAHKRQRYT